MAMDKVFSSRCIVVWLMALSILVGCEKEIDIDYHEIEPIMVVEGVLTNEDLNVTSSHCRPPIFSTVHADIDFPTLRGAISPSVPPERHGQDTSCRQRRELHS